MSSNKKAREELEKLYGKECFVEKLHLRKDTEPRKYTSKGQMKRMKQLTYHHIIEKRNRRKNNSREWSNIKSEKIIFGLISKVKRSKKK